MLANLVLSLAKDKSVFLMNEQELKNIDYTTSQYTEFDDFYLHSSFKSQIDIFYNRYQAYRNKIQNISNRKGKLYVQVFEREDVNSLDVLYSSFGKQINDKTLLNSIRKDLKNEESSKLILQIYEKYDFFLGSEYNYHNHLRDLLRKIQIYGLNERTKKEYYKLIKMIIDTVLLKKDSYFYARILYNFIAQQQTKDIFKGSVSSKSPIELAPSPLKSSPKTRKKVEPYHGMGDYFLREDYDREDVGENTYVKRYYK